MIKLDDNLLAELGLQALPAEEKKNLLRHIYETLEMRVGTTLAQQMTDAQLDEFESFINSNDEAGALHWLETNFPNYKDVVANEFELLKNEVRQASPQILASANQAATMPQQPMQQMQQPDPYQQYQQMPGQNPAQQYQPQQYAQPMPQQQPVMNQGMYQQQVPMPQPQQQFANPGYAAPANAPYPQQQPQQPMYDPYAQPYPPVAQPQQPTQDQFDQAA